MTTDQKLNEFAHIFRCTLDTAPTYIARIHERMGHEVPMDSILAVIRKIPPKRLTMDLIVERLKKLERAPLRARPAKTTREDAPGGDAPGGDAAAPGAEGGAAVGAAAPSRPRKAALPAATQGAGPMKQIESILAANWGRARKHRLKPPVMTPDLFVKRAQSIAGTPKPTLVRILKSIQKLDRRDVLITPNLVADDINESDEL